jgi:hypothetical protein
MQHDVCAVCGRDRYHHHRDDTCARYIDSIPFTLRDALLLVEHQHVQIERWQAARMSEATTTDDVRLELIEAQRQEIEAQRQEIEHLRSLLKSDQPPQ